MSLALVSILLGAACRAPNADEHFRRANEYAEQSRLPEAVIEYRAALQADPKRGDVRLKFGDALMRLREPDAALKEYVRAADALPNDADAQLKAGSLLLVGRGCVPDLFTMTSREPPARPCSPRRSA